jgi:hypothetical protein
VEIVPTVELPPRTPSTYHFTPVLVVPLTVAVNCLVYLAVTLALVGEIVMESCACTEAADKTTKQNAIRVRGKDMAFFAHGLEFSRRDKITALVNYR